MRELELEEILHRRLARFRGDRFGERFHGLLDEEGIAARSLVNRLRQLVRRGLSEGALYQLVSRRDVEWTDVDNARRA